MTGWISARRAEAFSSRLTSQDDGPARGDGPTPGRDADLLELVDALRSLESPAPRPEFLSELRERLMVEAGTVLHATPAERERAAREARLLLPERNPRRQRRLVAGIASVVLVGTGSTVAMAAQSALPGDSLYPIKRLVENARTTITFSDSAKGDSQLDHARARLREVADLIASGSPSSLAEVPDTLAAFETQAREGADTLLADFTSTGDRSSVQTVRTFAGDSLSRVKGLAEGSSGDTRLALAETARMLVSLDASAAALCVECTGKLPDVTDLVRAAEAPSAPLPSDGPGLPEAPPTIEGLPTLDPEKVAAANEPPSASPSRSVEAPSRVSSAQPPAGPNGPSTPNGRPPVTQRPDTTKAADPEPEKKPTSTTGPGTDPTKPPPKDVVDGLTDTLLGSEDGTTGVVPGVVGGVVGLVDGLLGALGPSQTPAP